MKIATSAQKSSIRLSPSLCLALLLIFALFWADSKLTDAQTPLPAAQIAIAVRGDLTQRQLSIGGRVVLERAASHFGSPVISPDGRALALAVTSTGTETDGYSQVHIFRLSDGKALGRVAGHSPVWQADSRGLAVEGRQGRLIYDTINRRTIGDPAQMAAGMTAEMTAQSTIPSVPIDPGNAPTYPEFIRVRHHPQNECRDVADWQVDVIPFEEYVARSVPAEVPVSWALDALAAQAVAARTYAWYQIRQNRPDYDVSDWADFQMMCDERWPASDQAVAMTAGQYLSYQGDETHSPIVAMYSAMNSHPTLDNPAVPYLRAVPDLTGLGEERWGHGFGMSQWGAARRARAGQSYRQILGHYFTDVNLQNALDPSQSIAGLLGPTQNGYLPPGGLRWNTLGSFSRTPGKLVVGSSQGLTRTLAVTTTQTISYTDVITHSSGVTETVTLTETTVITQTTYQTDSVTLPGSGVWQTAFALADGTRVETTLYQDDAMQESISLWVDRTPPPAPTLALPATTDSPTVTLTASFAPGSVLGLSNSWYWEGEHLSHSINSGRIISSTDAWAGAALEAHPGTDTPGSWYGPYTTALPPAATYRALFRLRMGDHPARSATGMLPDRPLARLDVTDQMGTVRLGLRDIWASDFAAPGQYQEIPVDFHIFEPTQGVEFRVAWYGDVSLALDRVWVWQLQPDEERVQRAWLLGRGKTPTVYAMTFDAAANASPAVSATVEIVDDGPPIFGAVSGPTGWQTELPITLTTIVQDRVSGLDGASGQLLLGEEIHPAWLDNPGNPWAEQRLTAVLDDRNGTLADGDFTVHFRIADLAGTTQRSPAIGLKLDRTPPEMSASATRANGEPISSAHGWLEGPLLVRIDASDATSGLSGVAYVLDDRPFESYSEPFPLILEGWRRVLYWAQDIAGNYQYGRYFEVGIDNSPPTSWVQLIRGESDTALASWGGSDALSGVAGYRVEIRRGEGGWQALLPVEGETTSETALGLAMDGEEALWIRVQAVDRVGHRSGWAETPLRTVSQIFLPAIAGGP